jgi:hypothetical protein
VSVFFVIPNPINNVTDKSHEVLTMLRSAVFLMLNYFWCLVVVYGTRRRSAEAEPYQAYRLGPAPDPTK